MNEAFECCTDGKHFTTLLLRMALPAEVKHYVQFSILYEDVCFVRQNGDTVHCQIYTGCQTNSEQGSGKICSSLTHKTSSECVKLKHHMGCEQYQALYR